MGKKRKSDLQMIESLHKENNELCRDLYDAKDDAKLWRRFATVLMEANEERTRLNHQIKCYAELIKDSVFGE